jgi:hypothetical protein
MPLALAECVDPLRFVLESILEVFPVDKRVEKSDRVNDLGWACVLVLKLLIPVVVDPMIGKSRLLAGDAEREGASQGNRRDVEGEPGGAPWDREHEDRPSSLLRQAFKLVRGLLVNLTIKSKIPLARNIVNLLLP